MIETAVKNEAITYFDTLDDNRIQMVLSYMKSLEPSLHKNGEHKLSDLKGKIQFSDGYDYKSMRNEK